MSAPLLAVLSRIPERTAELPALLPTLDTSALVNAAARHGVSALVADALERAAFADKARLLADARATVAAASKLRRFTLAVFDALLGAGVVPVVLKGAVLAHRLYPENPLGRPSSDVDVFVSLDELERVGRALEALGLRRQVDPALADELHDHHHLSFSGPQGLVEAHFKLGSSFGRDTDRDASIRARARAFDFAGRGVRVLAPEDELLYLASHAATHSFLRLSWLVDLKQLLRSTPSLDFALVARRAEDAGLLQALRVALGLLEAHLGVDLPRAARAAIPPRRLRGLLDSLLFSADLVESGRWSAHRVGSVGLRLWLEDRPLTAVSHFVGGMKRYARRARSSP